MPGGRWRSRAFQLVEHALASELGPSGAVVGGWRTASGERGAIRPSGVSAVWAPPVRKSSHAAAATAPGRGPLGPPTLALRASGSPLSVMGGARSIAIRWRFQSRIHYAEAARDPQAAKPPFLGTIRPHLALLAQRQNGPMAGFKGTQHPYGSLWHFISFMKRHNLALACRARRAKEIEECKAPVALG